MTTHTHEPCAFLVVVLVIVGLVGAGLLAVFMDHSDGPTGEGHQTPTPPPSSPSPLPVATPDLDDAPSTGPTPGATPTQTPRSSPSPTPTDPAPVALPFVGGGIE